MTAGELTAIVIYINAYILPKRANLPHQKQEITCCANSFADECLNHGNSDSDGNSSVENYYLSTDWTDPLFGRD